MTNSLAFRFIARVLRFFPMVLLALVLVSAGLAVRDFFFQTADQLVSVQSSLMGRK